jgi:sugar lactone lactonase YvrE
MICIAPDRYVYATEAIGARVQRISPADLWAGQVGRWGVELGQLYRPKGVAVDRQGELYVSDSTLGVVQVFSPLSRLEGVLTDARGKPLRFDHPMGLCFDAGGRLYVVELRAHRVAVVALGGKSPAASRHPADRKGGGQKQ